MFKKKSKLKSAQEEAQAAIDQTNKMIEKLGKHTGALCSALNDIQVLFDKIRNIPTERKIECDDLKSIRLNWKQQAEKIEHDYATAAVKNAGAGAAGVGAGVAVVALGPTAAMGVATTFGVASTGTAISALSGAAANSAALAWLGGGALVTGGGGMAAGHAFLALAGPVGWAIAGASLIASGIFLVKSFKDKKEVEEIFTCISKRDVESYKLAIVELNERMSRIGCESELLAHAIEKIKTFGCDYNAMTEAQQYELGSYVNLMSASTQLLINPIIGLLPKLNTENLNKFLANRNPITDGTTQEQLKPLILMLANLLYKIELNNKSKKLLYDNFRNNKKMIKETGINKKLFTIKVMDLVEDFLSYSYLTSKQPV